MTPAQRLIQRRRVALVERVKSYEVRSYISEKQQKGRRHWQGKAEEQRAVYQNRRRVRGGGSIQTTDPAER
jgi:hypothetical protein